MTTCINVGVLMLLLVGQLFLWAVFLRWGLRWGKVAPVSTKRIAATTLVVAVIQIAAFVFRLYGPVAPSLRVEFLYLAAVVVATLLVISIASRASFSQALRAWVLTLIPNLISVAISVLVLIPFVFEAFTTSANSMAPNLVGRHYVSTCSTCGKPCYRSPDDPNYTDGEIEPMICEAFHIHDVAELDRNVIPSDRFVVSKYLRPQRWDMVVFRCPDEHSVQYVKRLIGLPGETIIIKDGFAWANDQKLIPPDGLQGLRYSHEPPYQSMTLSGTEESPAVLGDGEYFMLGDFTTRSRDARYWVEGFPGHPPYAVPDSEIVGVVTHTYWPPKRWRIFR